MDRMPKKSAQTKARKKSTPAKRKVVKRSAPRVSTPMVASSAASRERSFREQQDDFYQDHPNAKALLLTFLVSFGLLAVLYLKLGW